MVPRLTWPLLLAGLLLPGPARAQGPAPEAGVSYTRQPLFHIPFHTDAGDRRIQQVQLFYSTDQGRNWRLYASAVPTEKYFKQFTAEQDGLFWFAVRTQDVAGQFYPPAVESLRPQLKVFVDTQPPAITLEALPPREGTVGVRWEVRDENLDPASLRLDYRLPGAGDWRPLGMDAVAVGQRYWQAGTNGAQEVRLQARDRADNRSEKIITINPAGNGGAGFMSATGPGAASDNIRMVNSKRISLNYEVQDVGPSGISLVELWYTRDGRNWQKYRDYPNQQPPLVFEVQDEGLYGFTLIVRSGVGLGERPPQVGDPPQAWVKVDLTNPVVRLLGAEVGRGNEAGNLTITWSATDENLGRQPVTLSYAEQAEGTWTPIAANLENTGRYVWKMPPTGVPYRFLVRVEAADRAGNVGRDQTANPVIVDLAKPRASILKVEPAEKTGN
jgi:hypothetical protein